MPNPASTHDSATRPPESRWIRLMQRLPIALVTLRFLLGPLLLWDVLNGSPSGWFVIGLVLAFVSDILDGVIARRCNVSTAGLRQADSWADLCFYSCIAACTWLVHREVVLAFRVPLLLVLAAQVSLYGLSWLKFGKAPSYHTYSAKAWGITLFIAAVSLFGFGNAGSLWFAIIGGLINSGEEIAMTLVLPTWQHDVLSFRDALRLHQAS